MHYIFDRKNMNLNHNGNTRKIAKVYITRNRSNFKACRLRKTSNDPHAPRLYTGNEIVRCSQQKISKSKVYANKLSNFNCSEAHSKKIAQCGKEKISEGDLRGRYSIVGEQTGSKIFSDEYESDFSGSVCTNIESLNCSVVVHENNEEHLNYEYGGNISENNCVLHDELYSSDDDQLIVPSRNHCKPSESISNSKNDNNSSDLLRRWVYNTRSNNSSSDDMHRKTNIESCTTSDDFIGIGDMKYVKVVRWDHPSTSAKVDCSKKCGIDVKNYTIENICKFNNIHYAKLGFNKFLSSRLYVDEVNNLLSIYPLQYDDQFDPTQTKRKHSRRKRGNLQGKCSNAGEQVVDEISSNECVSDFSPKQDGSVCTNIESDPVSLNSSVVCENEEQLSNESDRNIAQNNCMSCEEIYSSDDNDLNVPSRNCCKSSESIDNSRNDNKSSDLLRNRVYNTRNNNSSSDDMHRKTNIESCMTSDDFIGIGDMKYVKVVRWDHPSNKGKVDCSKKCGMDVKNYTIENICKFNNIHYSKLGFNKFLSSRLYVDEVNNLLSIYPLQYDDPFNPGQTKRNHSRRKRGIENSSIEKYKPRTVVSELKSGELPRNFSNGDDAKERERTTADQIPFMSSSRFDVKGVCFFSYVQGVS